MAYPTKDPILCHSTPKLPILFFPKAEEENAKKQGEEEGCSSLAQGLGCESASNVLLSHVKGRKPRHVSKHEESC